MFESAKCWEIVQVKTVFVLGGLLIHRVLQGQFLLFWQQFLCFLTWSSMCVWTSVFVYCPSWPPAGLHSVIIMFFTANIQHRPSCADWGFVAQICLVAEGNDYLWFVYKVMLSADSFCLLSGKCLHGKAHLSKNYRIIIIFWINKIESED